MGNHKINLKLNDLELSIIIKIVGLVLEALKLLKSKKHATMEKEVDLLSINNELEAANGNTDIKPEADTEGVA